MLNFIQQRWFPVGVFLILMALSIYVGVAISPSLTVLAHPLTIQTDDIGPVFIKESGRAIYPNFISTNESTLQRGDTSDPNRIEYVKMADESGVKYIKYDIAQHFHAWSLLPAIVAILLCWLTKDPLTSLLGGVFSGAMILQRYNITEDVFVAELMSKSAAGVLILYLWLLGALMGIWSKYRSK